MLRKLPARESKRHAGRWRIVLTRPTFHQRSVFFLRQHGIFLKILLENCAGEDSVVACFVILTSAHYEGGPQCGHNYFPEKLVIIKYLQRDTFNVIFVLFSECTQFSAPGFCAEKITPHTNRQTLVTRVKVPKFLNVYQSGDFSFLVRLL